MEIAGDIYMFEFMFCFFGTLALGAIYTAMNLKYKEQSLDCSYYVYGEILLFVSDLLLAIVWASVLIPWVAYSQRPGPAVTAFTVCSVGMFIWSNFVFHERKRCQLLTESLNKLETKYGLQKTSHLYPLFKKHGMRRFPLAFMEAKASLAGTEEEKRKQMVDCIQTELVSVLEGEEAGQALIQRARTLKRRTAFDTRTPGSVFSFLTDLIWGEEPQMVDDVNHLTFFGLQ